VQSAFLQSNSRWLGFDARRVSRPLLIVSHPIGA